MAVRTSIIEALARDMAWDGSESGTEEFLVKLLRASEDVYRQMKQSHKEGLCYDCINALSDKLNA